MASQFDGDVVRLPEAHDLLVDELVRRLRAADEKRRPPVVAALVDLGLLALPGLSAAYLKARNARFRLRLAKALGAFAVHTALPG